MSAKVAEAINAIMGKVGYIQKKGTNSFHNYKFAAIGDVLAELQPAMHEAGLIVVQDEVEHELIANETIMTARYAFQLLHTSGEAWPTVAHHTGMAAAKTGKGTPDDKALNKCHTAARKYFLMALFQIPTGDHADPDADGDVPTKGKKPPQAEQAPAPDTNQTPRTWRDSESRLHPAAAKRRNTFEPILKELYDCADGAEIALWIATYQDEFDLWPEPWLFKLEDAILTQEAAIAEQGKQKPSANGRGQQSTLEAH